VRILVAEEAKDGAFNLGMWARCGPSLLFAHYANMATMPFYVTACMCDGYYATAFVLRECNYAPFSSVIYSMIMQTLANPFLLGNGLSASSTSCRPVVMSTSAGSQAHLSFQKTIRWPTYMTTKIGMPM